MRQSDYPTPDPSWDYAGIWHQVQAAQSEIEELLAAMADVEDANRESDRLIEESLEKVQKLILSANALLRDRHQ